MPPLDPLPAGDSEPALSSARGPRPARVLRIVDRGRSEEVVAPRALRLRRAMFVGAIGWGSFAALDPLVVHWLGTGRIWWMLLLQAFGLVVLLGVGSWVGRHGGAPRRVLLGLDLLAFVTIGTLLGGLALELGGTSGPVMPAIMAVLVARGIALPEQWHRGLLLTGMPLLSFLVVVFGGSWLTSLPIAPDGAVATRLALDLCLMVVTLALMVVASHTSWSLRKELFEARQLGRYTLRHRLGRGGMGEVWVAQHQGLRRDVALKILTDTHRDERALRRFEREVAAMSRLAHPNIVRILDYGRTEDGFAYLAMELLEGLTLAELIERVGPLPVERALSLARQTARALSEAHARGIIHRDVKPENLFVARVGGDRDVVKVLDFGVATVLGGGLQHTIESAGTPLYLSPEVARGEPAGPSSDLYGLGCVLFFMLTGRPPFDREGPAELLLAHANDEPPTVSAARVAPVSPALEVLVARCLAKDPAARPSSATALANTLEALQGAGASQPAEGAAVARLGEPHPGSGPTLADLTLVG